MTFIFLIIAGWLIYSVNNLKEASKLGNQDKLEIETLKVQVSALKERVEVLEKIATDDNAGLKRDIDSL
ncbi:hypothetical protein Q4575_07785 [Psychrosphaera sp. 1_MG-2023]|uniref:Phage shock protein B n=1 Tax=Psychrosphaera algicola TaxID=3023714 RepID=A0ABT5FBI3_9GAMM|nr:MULTISPECIES: hypothetical protein [unclassified Psychrosphaera]MDC2888885.1 hypothetical protein [Psychrosphaera sp. G1-22]MDO6719294.1 hypothetical protein [Psychrosphaera sp. 1_MG-2023]